MVVKFDHLDNLMINNYNKKFILVITTSAKKTETVGGSTDRQTDGKLQSNTPSLQRKHDSHVKNNFKTVVTYE